MVKMLAAITTPFAADGEVDLDAFDAHLRWLSEGGLDGVFVAGTTGEGVLLENDEVAALDAARRRRGGLAARDRAGRAPEHARHGEPGAARAGRRRGRRRGLRAVVLSGHPGPGAGATSWRVLEAAGDAPAFLYNIPPRTVNDLEPGARRRARRAPGSPG